MGVARIFIARIPLPLGNLIADRLGDVIYYFAGKSRRAATANLRCVMQGAPRSKVQKAVHGVFRNVMRNYFDLCRAPNLTDAQIDRLTTFDEVGWQRMMALHEQGRGIVLVTGHFGAFDMITQLITRRGVSISAIVAQVKPAWLSDFVTDLRAGRGLNVLMVEEEEGGKQNLGALKEAIRLLKSGEILVVLADRNMEQQGVTIKFFGHDTVMAPGVAKMALKTKAVVVPGFGRRLPKDRYSVVFDEPIDTAGLSSSEDDIKTLLQQIFARVEKHIGRNPEQWVLLQPVWGREL